MVEPSFDSPGGKGSIDGQVVIIGVFSRLDANCTCACVLSRPYTLHGELISRSCPLTCGCNPGSRWHQGLPDPLPTLPASLTSPPSTLPFFLPAPASSNTLVSRPRAFAHALPSAWNPLPMAAPSHPWVFSTNVTSPEKSSVSP